MLVCRDLCKGRKRGGIQQIGGVWYFFDENAYCKTNTWVFWNGKWYYLDVNGAMLVNTTTPDGKQVGEDGALL